MADACEKERTLSIRMVVQVEIWQAEASRELRLTSSFQSDQYFVLSWHGQRKFCDLVFRPHLSQDCCSISRRKLVFVHGVSCML